MFFIFHLLYNPRMSKTQPDREHLARTALKLAAQKGWENVSLRDIAIQSEISLARLHDLVQDKTDVLVVFGRMIDRQVLEQTSLPTDGNNDNHNNQKEILFDLLMDRFEALNEHRAGVVAVLQSFKFDPKQAVIALPYLAQSMTWMLEAARIDTNGIKGALRLTGLLGLYLKTLRVWADDDSSDLAKTMAALDQDLTRVEQWAGRLGL